MTFEEKSILIRCLQMIDELIESEPAEWQTWAYTPWAEQVERGPAYRVSRWFGAQCERNRVRYRRAIDKLESAGLITSYRAWGTRLSNIDLTEEGILMAEQLRREAAESATEP